ncbi:MAG: histidine triad nucleotide-binding protein [Dehalococcoidia bacterium]|nr:histidine triad nucleotide-binding protein [Dehalococcoidia bacterium]
MDCPFCGIMTGRIPSKLVYQDDRVGAFLDLSPQAPHHILVVPTAHISSLNEMWAKDEALIGHLVVVAIDLARREGFAESGYRMAINCGREGGQVVPHLHLHLLGGRQLSSSLG